jgi:hypothetical protein
VAKADTLTEVLRYVWRESLRAGVSPSLYLDQLADESMSAQLEGRVINAASGSGSSTQFLVFANWSPEQTLETISRLRTAAAQTTLAAALTTLGVEPINDYRTDFRGAFIR